MASCTEVRVVKSSNIHIGDKNTQSVTIIAQTGSNVIIPGNTNVQVINANHNSLDNCHNNVVTGADHQEEKTQTVPGFLDKNNQEIKANKTVTESVKISRLGECKTRHIENCAVVEGNTDVDDDSDNEAENNPFHDESNNLIKPGDCVDICLQEEDNWLEYIYLGIYTGFKTLVQICYNGGCVSTKQIDNKNFLYHRNVMFSSMTSSMPKIVVQKALEKMDRDYQYGVDFIKDVIEESKETRRMKNKNIVKPGDCLDVCQRDSAGWLCILFSCIYTGDDTIVCISSHGGEIKRETIDNSKFLYFKNEHCSEQFWSKSQKVVEKALLKVGTTYTDRNDFFKDLVKE